MNNLFIIKPALLLYTTLMLHIISHVFILFDWLKNFKTLSYPLVTPAYIIQSMYQCLTDNWNLCAVQTQQTQGASLLSSVNGTAGTQ